MLIAVAIFALILFISITVFTGLNYYYSEMKEISEEAFAFARSAAKYIDGDKVQFYLEHTTVNKDGTKTYPLDDYYDDVKNYLVSVRDEHDTIKYYYVFVPDLDSVEDKETVTIMYLWDAAEGADVSSIGDTEEYEAGIVKSMYNKEPQEILTTYKDDLWGNIACAFSPIYNSYGEPVAAVGVDMAIASIRSSLDLFILTIVVVITGIVIIASIVFYLLIRKNLVKPIGMLNNAALELVGNLDSGKEFHIDIHTRDELEELAQSFGAMDADLKDYIKRLSAVTAEKERIGAELNVAAQIQADMLPRDFPAFPDRHEFDLYATMTPAKEVGGDFYDFFMIDDDHIALVIADVSGKGVPAALFMVITKTLIKNHAQSGKSPAEILETVSEQLSEGNEAELFVTVWLAIIEISTGKGVAANAGHEHPALRRAGGKYELVVYPHSIAVALMEGMPFDEHEFKLEPGDSLFVYTDGVPEAATADDQFFRTGRMLDALNRDPGARPKQLLENVRQAINDFVGETDQSDDITMLCFSYSGGEKKEEPDELTIEAKDENLDTVLRFVGERYDKLGGGAKARTQVEVSSEEIFLNVAHYAYKPDAGEITVRFEHKTDPDRAVITFIDGGKPFDPVAMPDPDTTLPLEERREGGVGIFMTKNYADAIRYERKEDKNVLIFEKNI
jgi:sigma-B regulation protein RsbU (phosphoserine phosphatase)